MKPRLLFLTNQLPYPPVSGGVIKSWRFIRHLCAHFDVTLFTLLKNSDADHVADMRSGADLKQYFGVAIDRPRSALNFLKSLVFSPTLNSYRNDSTVLRTAVAKALPEHDLVLIDHLEMAQYVAGDAPLKVVLHQHNAEFIMWQRSVSIARNVAEKLVLKVEAARVKRFEIAACTAADLVFAAPNDQDELVPLGVPKEKFRTTYHLGDDSGLHATLLDFDRTGMTLLYVGTLSWPANADGLRWFLADVFPELKRQHPDLRLDIVGKGADEGLQAAVAACNGAELLGFVEDLEPLYQRSRVFIAPLRFGSGTKVKVVTALYRGLPCATTSIGTEGLDLSDGAEVMLADDAAGTIARIDTLLTDRMKWEHMRDESRKKAARDLSWNNMLDAHVRDLNTLLAQPS
ncbi:MAG: glycosyltransferase [Flavobacteriales bacterium]